jgi:tellurite methyltransferase
VIRTVEGFRQDEQGDWVADLSCLHAQHVRHSPPFRERPWVLTDEGRAAHVGSALDCPLCDRAELPEGLVVVRTAGPFDESSLPASLRRDHRVAERTWGRVRVLDGRAGFRMATSPPVERALGAGDAQAIPPGVDHAVIVHGPVRLAVDFLVRAAQVSG